MSAMIIRKKQAYRRLVTYYRDLIQEPAKTSLTLPADGRFLITSTEELAVGQLIASLQSVDGVSTVYARDTTGTILDWLRKGSTVTVESGCILQLDTGLAVYKTVLTS